MANNSDIQVSMEQRILKVLKVVFSAYEGPFQDSFGPPDILGWDSLNHLNLIMALQEEFNVELGFEEMMEITVVGDIKRVLDKKIS